jgi:CHAT domain-containing protein/tetratricopeptide (TPR) repeat protein
VLKSYFIKIHRLLTRKGLCWLGLALALGVGVTASGCRRTASPDTTLLQIRREMGQGQLNVALRDVDAALARYQTRNPEWAARFRVQKGQILMLRGSYSDSLQLLSEPLPHSLSRSDTEVQRKMVQGVVYIYLQQLELCDRALSEAEGMAVTIQSSFLGDVALARGILEMDRKNYAKAAAAYRTAAAFAKDHNLSRTELNAQASLGNVAMWQEHYDEAVDHFKTALERSRALGAAVIEAKTLGNLGWNYSVVGDFESAEDYLKEAEKASIKAGLLGDQVKWLNALSDVYFQQHRYDIAGSTSEEALLLARKVGDNRDITNCLNSASDIALATGHTDVAGKYNREALEIEQSGLDQFGIASSTIIAGRIAAGKKQFAEAAGTFQKILADPSIETALKWEAHARLAEVYAAEHQPMKAEHEFGLAIRNVQRTRDSVHRDEFRVSFLSSAIQFYDAYINFLIGQRRPLDALKIADVSRAQTLEEGLSSKDAGQALRAAIDPQDIARRMNATLLFYWIGEERSHLWVITPTRISLFQLPRRAEIDGAEKSYIESFTDPRDPLETGNADAKKLYTTLIQPTEKLIPKNSRVVVLPDGNLNSLNFETLIVPGEKPHYWIEDVTLLTANSLSLLSRGSLSAPPINASLFLVADAVSASPDFPPLPQAGKEVSLVEKYFPEERRFVLTGAQATASHFLSSKPEEFAYLHFATHGTASTTRPLESAVILSPEGDSYKLYARDIVQHPLHAYLVTISACNGAGMRTYAGEGLVGLAWAFLRAGAHNVIAGLWEVSNASTPQLMDELYKGLHEGKDPATALRNAKLTLVHSSGNYRKPFYWAPFQLYAGS